MWPFKKTIKNYPESFTSERAGVVVFRDELEDFPVPGTEEVVEIRSFGYHGRWESLGVDVFFVPPEKGDADVAKWAAVFELSLAHVQDDMQELLSKAGPQVDSLRHEGESEVVETSDVREFIKVDRVKVVTGEGCYLLCTVFVTEERSIEVDVSFNMQFDFLRAEIIGGGYLFG